MDENNDNDDDDNDDDDDDDDGDESDAKAVHIEDVAEHLIPIDGDCGGVCDIEYMIKVTCKDLLNDAYDRIKKQLEEMKEDVMDRD